MALVAAVTASGKEGAPATLTTSISPATPAGSTFRVAWIVTILDSGKRRPFGAGGMFVRLLGRVPGASTKVYAQGVNGRYRATVTVPRGGLRGIQLGVRSR